jgi:two-component system nitrate/nitrite sensor histidine kinase NarX
MRKPHRFDSVSIPWLRLAVFVGAFLLFLTAWQFVEVELGFAFLAYWTVALILSAGTAWLSGSFVLLDRQSADLQAKLGEANTRLPALEQRLDSLMKLNRAVLDAEDEKSLMDTALGIISDLACADAVTFVPMDEWGQPLSAFTYGDLPEPVLTAWAHHLVSPDVRHACGACTNRYVAPNMPCPILEGPFRRSVHIYCLPLWRGDRMLGMFNLLLPPDQKLSEEMQNFIQGLLSEIGMAVHTLRLRNQELSTLRQLQMVRGTKSDLSHVIDGLLEGLRQTLNVEFVLLQGRPIGQLQTGLQIQKGFSPWLDSKYLQSLYERLLTGQDEILNAKEVELREEEGYALGAPMLVQFGQALGAIIIADKHPLHLTDQEAALLRSTAAQAAMLIENERTFLSLEYNAVIQERVRLAREIHDGLAQTLAFLKMKTSQMQNILTQGDLKRLRQVLQQNYQALSEAYLDTRQAIDNLRLTPQQGLVNWLEDSCTEFEKSTGIQVQQAFESEPHKISPEVQAQLIRIVQEAMSNIRKHARATRVWVSLRQWEGDLIIEVGDDGDGFAPEDVPMLSQYGLRGMRERAEFIGADFQIISQIRQGTVVRLRLPKVEEAVQ